MREKKGDSWRSSQRDWLISKVLNKETDTENKKAKKKNLHLDQAYPVAQEALPLLVDPAFKKENKNEVANISSDRNERFFFPNCMLCYARLSMEE